jgi:hypothetical protein
MLYLGLSYYNRNINKGIAKLRKYYLKTSVLENKSKALYLALILDPRIKREGLTRIGLTSGIESDIYNRLKTDYNRYVYIFNLLFFKFINFIIVIKEII